MKNRPLRRRPHPRATGLRAGPGFQEFRRLTRSGSICQAPWGGGPSGPVFSEWRSRFGPASVQASLCCNNNPNAPGRCCGERQTQSCQIGGMVSASNRRIPHSFGACESNRQPVGLAYTDICGAHRYSFARLLAQPITSRTDSGASPLMSHHVG
jgi:hypothetical protein